MKVEVNINKKLAFGIMASILVLTGSILVFALWDPAGHTVWHDANDVKVSIGGIDYSLQEALDSSSFPSGLLCPDSVGSSGPCYEAAQNEGVGTDNYRAINCVNRLGKNVGRGIRYNSNQLQWQYLTDTSTWAHCDDTSTLVVRIG